MKEEGRGKSAFDPELALPFKQKAVYYYWHIVSRKEWRLADTPLASARKFIETNSEMEFISLLDVEAEPGTEALAFYVTDFVEGWAKHTQELAMDSTCECSAQIYPTMRPRLQSNLI